MTEADRRLTARIAKAHGLSEEDMAAASAALARLERRRGEDIGRWAECLASDLAHAGEEFAVREQKRKPKGDRHSVGE